MGIFDRLGTIINSYLNDMENDIPFRRGQSRSGDRDFDDAYEELNDFLNGKKSHNEGNSGGWYENDTREENYRRNNAQTSQRQSNLPPEELRPDFECLGVPFGAGEQECKTAYKNLLKIHHPDRHIGHEGNFKKATERTMKINAAYDRIEKWRKP